MYWLKWDYGCGDWGSSGQYFTDKDAIDAYNNATGFDCESIDECMSKDHSIYSLEYGEEEKNENWMDC